MTIIWLIVWLLSSMPHMQWFGDWNAWGVTLLSAIIIDVIILLCIGGSGIVDDGFDFLDF